MFSSLCPSNNHVLRDNVSGVSGSVVQRLIPRNCGQDHFNATRQSLGLQTPVDQHHLRDQDIPSLVTTKFQSNNELKKKPKRRSTYRRREQCRINQARYRRRQREYEENIKLSIDRLKYDIRDLQIEHKNILSETPVTQNMWTVVTEYVSLLQTGFVEGTPVVGMNRTLPGSSFLSLSTAENVTNGFACGMDAILENWKLLAFYHDDMQVRIQSIEHLTENSLLVHVVVRLTITMKTLQYLYPHLIISNNKETAQLAENLLNQRLLVRGTMRFDWDALNERVVRLDSNLDILTPMLKLLGSLEHVARVFDNALMTSEGRFRSIIGLYG